MIKRNTNSIKRNDIPFLCYEWILRTHVSYLSIRILILWFIYCNLVMKRINSINIRFWIRFIPIKSIWRQQFLSRCYENGIVEHDFMTYYQTCVGKIVDTIAIFHFAKHLLLHHQRKIMNFYLCIEP